MLGKSSMFFDAGYVLPKYQLPLGGETVFAKSVKTFESLFDSMQFLFLVRSDYGAAEFVVKEILKLGIKDFRVKEFCIETQGQAESVYLGTADYSPNVPLIIFNIDTIRLNFSMPAQHVFGDGFLEVFNGEGEHWSFVEPGKNGQVIRTTEKDRISNLCSNGLYGFSRCENFRDAYLKSVEAAEYLNKEIYVAPLFNKLIAQNYKINYVEVDPRNILHCGTPDEYENLKTILSNKMVLL
jgi:hypothetical protein